MLLKIMLLHGNEIWNVSDDDDIKRLECDEKSMVKWLSNAYLRNYTSSEYIKSKLGVELTEAIRTGR